MSPSGSATSSKAPPDSALPGANQSRDLPRLAVGRAADREEAGSHLPSEVPEPVLPVAERVALRQLLWQGVVILLFLETGLFLVAFPWSSVWDQNLVVGYFPWLRPVFLSYYLRGAVSGLGLINLWMGISQARRLARLRNHARAGQ